MFQEILLLIVQGCFHRLRDVGFRCYKYIAGCIPTKLNLKKLLNEIGNPFQRQLRGSKHFLCLIKKLIQHFVFAAEVANE
jgi:hypothetical protein